MSVHPDLEQLEEWLAGGPDAAARAAIEGHLAGCPECAREAALLRAEGALFARRSSAQDRVAGREELWAQVARRVGAPAADRAPAVEPAPARVIPLRPRWQRRALGAAAVALSAAAVLAISLRVKDGPRAGPLASAPDAALADEDDGAPDPRVASALARAEADQARAVQVLEGELRERREGLDPAEAERFDASLQRARARLDAARAVAQDDVDGRVRVLGGYARYLRSLQQTLLDSEEAAP